MTVRANVVCREARLAVTGIGAGMHAIAEAGESPAREALRLAARAELLRRGIEADGFEPPRTLERAIAALLAAAKELGSESA